ncbi:MAG: hypothetical protein AAB530_02760 [Patescibacteria group bacterium]
MLEIKSPYGIRPIDNIDKLQRAKEEEPKNNIFKKILNTKIREQKESSDRRHCPLPGGKFDFKA